MLKQEERDVKDAMMLHPEQRTEKGDVQNLIRRYLQANCDEFKNYHDPRFYSSLQYGCTAVTNIAKNESIPNKPGVIRIIYQGTVLDTFSE